MFARLETPLPSQPVLQRAVGVARLRLGVQDGETRLRGLFQEGSAKAQEPFLSQFRKLYADVS